MAAARRITVERRAGVGPREQESVFRFSGREKERPPGGGGGRTGVGHFWSQVGTADFKNDAAHLGPVGIRGRSVLRRAIVETRHRRCGSMNLPTCPELERSLALAHSRFIPLQSLRQRDGRQRHVRPPPCADRETRLALMQTGMSGKTRMYLCVGGPRGG